MTWQQCYKQNWIQISSSEVTSRYYQKSEARSHLELELVDSNITDNIKQEKIGSRVESWEITALTGLSREHFPSRLIRNRLFPRSEEILWKNWLKTPWDLKFVKKSNPPIPVKSYWYIKWYGPSRTKNSKIHDNSINENYSITNH